MATTKKKPTAKQLAARKKFAAAAKAGTLGKKKKAGTSKLSKIRSKAKKATSKKRKAVFKLSATDAKEVRGLLKKVGQIRDKYLKKRKSAGKQTALKF